MKRWLLWALCGVAVLIVVALWAAPRGVPVETGVVGPATLRSTVVEDGETRVRERFVVSAPVQGRVRRIVLDPGDPVVAGETVLAEFLPTAPILLDARSRAEARAALEAAEAALGRARADVERTASELEFARSEERRIQALATDGIVSPSALEQAQLLVRTRAEAASAARYQVGTARGELQAARARLMQVSGDDRGAAIALRAPIDGVVLRLIRESEAVVPAGEPLMEVGDPTVLELVVDYLSRDAVRMQAGGRALIRNWGGEELEGSLLRVEPSGFTKISALGVEEKRVNVIVTVDSPPERWSGLGDGFRVDVAAILWEREVGLAIPNAALFRVDGDWATFVVDGGRARRVIVTVGAQGDDRSEILAGVDAGTEVVLYPGLGLDDGTRVDAALERAA